MFLSSINISNFRIHKNTKIDFDKINVLVGKNGSGKTSVLQAICWALYGGVTTKAKKNELIRYGAKEGSVELMFDDGHKIFRNFKGATALHKDDQLILDKDGDLKDWLNISKETFFNIIYGAQNEMCTFFQNFNAKEKDFIDGILVPENPCHKILLTMDDLKKQVNSELIRKKTTLQNKIQARQYKSSILQTNGFSCVEQISEKLDEIQNKLSNFPDIKLIMELKNKIQNYQSMINNYENDIRNSERSVLESQNRFQHMIDHCEEAKKNLLSSLEIGEGELSSVDKIIAERFDLQTNIDEIEQVINDPRAEDVKFFLKVLEYLKGMISKIKTLDQTRSKFLSLHSAYKNSENAKNQSLNFVEFEKKKIEEMKTNALTYFEEAKTLIDQYNQLTSGEDYSSYVEEFNALSMESQRLSMLIENIRLYDKSLQEIEDVDELELNKMHQVVEKIDVYRKIFDRDGFMSYFRNYMLEEIADKTDEFLKSFGFDDLFPVNVHSGELVFNNKRFSLLSGGQQIITAIILRIIFARIISPGMRWNTIILDEPTTGVDEYRIPLLKDYFSELSTKLQMQLFIITHHDGVIPTEANTIYL